MNWIAFAVGLIGTAIVLGLLSLKSLLYVCQPNQVLIFSGSNRRVGDRRIGYRVIKGGNAWRKPFLERVDQVDLTNMIIELNAVGAYAKGGVPLNVQGVANVKIAGFEPVLNNAIERFLGKGRQEIMLIAKATLEGSLRGVLATLSPEQLNNDRNAFAERLVEEVETDLTALGLVVDTLKIQNITDDVRYLDSIGRIRNSELISSARTAEAIATADSKVRSAENRMREVEAQIKAEMSVAKADAERRLRDAQTRRAALVAEEQAAVAALVAQAESEIKVQEARIEQTRRRLEADVIAPAKAGCEAKEAEAKASVAHIVEDGRARAEAIGKLADTWNTVGPQAREIMLLQKLEPIIHELTQSIATTRVEKLTLIDSSGSGSGGSLDPKRLLVLSEQIKEVFGVDVVDKLKTLGEAKPEPRSKQEARAAMKAEPINVEVTEPTPPPIPK
ncbi:MAG: hypothetical protein KF812_09035 [Fimbriimonadaceae bacterium]|nr:hypothetical protein [Fimbriimonadaceae bacterium]